MSAFLANLSSSTSRREVAETVIKIQTYLGLRPNSVNTLIKKPVEELHELVGTLLGDELVLNDAGEVAPVPALVEAPKTDDASTDTSGTEEGDDEADDGRTSKLAPPGHVITVTTVLSGAKFRAGSASAKRFGLLESGITVSEFVKRCADVGDERGLRTIRKALRRGYITLAPAVAE
jgi:hypothetical protein